MSKLSEMTLYEIFNHAIQREREAQKLYRHAATLAGESTPLRRMFLAFAQEEQRHEEQLVEQYPEFKRFLPKSDNP